MKIKKNIKKATVGLLASAMAISGAFAWLTNSEAATKQNNISVGTSKVIFEDGTNVINLTDNLAIPMTNEYAVANLTPYTFKVSNKGTVDMEYSLTAVNEDSTTIDPSLVMIQLDGRTPITLADANLMSGKKIAAGTSDSHSLIAYIKETGTIDNVPNRVANFHLELTAVQTDMSVLPTVNMSYAAMSKSQIATSITAGGETKNVEVYNIEGASKTELLNKLQESGLANPSEVDALVEVKGEDYDGLNSTATFDVSTVANPGDTVVILHFNETTQEWEYVGEETVGEDNTVSGDFTSYSPVAFIVVSKDNNTGETGSGDVQEDGNVLINETNFPDENFRNYVKNNLDADGNGKLSETERNITYLNVSGQNIASLEGVEYFTHLTQLYCGANKLTTLDLSHNTELTSLYFNDNEIETIDLSKNTALETIKCQKNKLTALNLSENTLLKYLECNNNQLESLNISNSGALRELYCRYNNLTSLDVTNNVNLIELEFSNNQVSNIDLTKNVLLWGLWCENNQLTTLDVSQNVNLGKNNMQLKVYGNKISELNLSNNPLLTSSNVFADSGVEITYAS